MNNIRRWNFESDGINIEVCKDLHEKGQPCEYEPLTIDQLYSIITQLQSEVNKLVSEKNNDIDSDSVYVKITKEVNNQLNHIRTTRDFSTSESIQFLLDHQI